MKNRMQRNSIYLKYVCESDYLFSSYTRYNKGMLCTTLFVFRDLCKESLISYYVCMDTDVLYIYFRLCKEFET